jgi:hypothetical protein
MKERPILFSTIMVKAILEGRKTQTRRIMKIQPDGRGTRCTNVHFEDWHGRELKCPYGWVGDLLWVRETWQKIEGNRIIYKADPIIWGGKWKSSIFMPKQFSRIKLQITDIRVEKLCDISEEDAMAEGIDLPNYAEQANKDVKYPEPSDIYAELWDEINGTGSWIKNSWVWVIIFTIENLNKKPWQ